MKCRLLSSLAPLLLLVVPAAAQVSPPEPTTREMRAIARRAELQAQQAQEQAQANLDAARRTYDVALSIMEKSERELRDQTHRLDVSPEALQKAAAHLDEQLEALELDEVGSAARRKATEVAMKEEMDRVEKHVKDDPVVSELQNVLKAREAQLARLKQLVQTAAVPQSEYDAAAASVAEAKAKLTERQQSSYGGVDAESLAALRRDLLNLSIGEEERQAKLQYLKMQQQRLSDAMNRLTDMQQRQYEVQRARQLLERAQERLERQRLLNAHQSPQDPAEKQ
jgi:hypothetical protein